MQVQTQLLELNLVRAHGTLNGDGLYPVFYSGATERPQTCEQWVACSGLPVFSSLIIIRRSSTQESAVAEANKHGNLGECSLVLCPWAPYYDCPELYPAEGSPWISWSQWSLFTAGHLLVATAAKCVQHRMRVTGLLDSVNYNKSETVLFNSLNSKLSPMPIINLFDTEINRPVCSLGPEKMHFTWIYDKIDTKTKTWFSSLM
jgi:hypothetical protein